MSRPARRAQKLTAGLPPRSLQDPARAQRVLRERARLTETVDPTSPSSRRSRRVCAELAREGEAVQEGSAAPSTADPVARRGGARSDAHRRATPTTPSSPSVRARAAPNRRTGPRCWPDVPALGGTSQYRVEAPTTRRARKRGSERHPDGARPQLWVPAGGTACIAWYASRRSTLRAGATRRSPAFTPTREPRSINVTIQDKDLRIDTIAAAAQRAARQRHRLGGARHPPPDRIVVSCQNERSRHAIATWR